MIDNRRKAPDAYMPLWIGDYLADTTHLTTEQHGAYLLLLMAYWRRQGRPLPADDQTLATIAKVSIYKWRSLRPIMVALFTETNGTWVNKRADEEWGKALALKAARAAAGAKGAEISNSRRSKAAYLPPHNIRQSAPEVSSALTTIAATVAEQVEIADFSDVNHGKADAEPSANEQPSPSYSKKKNIHSQRESHSLLVRVNEREPLEEPKPASKPISSKIVRGTRWPAGQQLPPDWIAAAAAKRSERGLPMIDLGLEAEKFVNYWTAKSGAHATKVDWAATWRNWSLNANGVVANGRSNGTGQHGRAGEAGDYFLETYLAERAARLEREAARH